MAPVGVRAYHQQTCKPMTTAQSIVAGGLMAVGIVVGVYLLLPAFRAEAALGLLTVAAIVFTYRMIQD